MTSLAELPNVIERRQDIDRRKEQKAIDFEDRRIAEYRRAADRHEEAGNTATARMYRNDAYRLECEQEGKPLL